MGVYIAVQGFGVPGSMFGTFGAFTFSHVFGFFGGLVISYILDMICLFLGVELNFYLSRFFMKSSV